MDITFSPLRRCDLPLLARWLAEPVVARWWNHDPSGVSVERDFGPSIDGHDATEMFVVAGDGEPFGFIQRYRVDAYADYAAALAAVWPVPAAALSIDYLIGAPEWRDRGLGTAMIRAFCPESWRAHGASADIVVPVPVGNRASWRALERAGFARVAEGDLEPDNPVDPLAHYLYRLRRPPAQA